METPGFPAACRAIRSHRTGRTTQEVEEWTDPEEAAKEAVVFWWDFLWPQQNPVSSMGCLGIFTYHEYDVIFMILIFMVAWYI